MESFCLGCKVCDAENFLSGTKNVSYMEEYFGSSKNKPSISEHVEAYTVLMTTKSNLVTSIRILKMNI